MMLHRNRLRNFLLAFALLGMAAVASPVVQAATFVVINADGAGEGFNDPTAAAPVGGNSGATVGQQRLIAFQHAADLWGARLSSSVTIRVRAQFNPLSCTASSGTLGSAGPTLVFRDFAGAPVAGTWFPSALANALNGGDLDPDDDIAAQFNSNIGTPGCLSSSGWYYGLDSNPPANQFDFVTVLLHELGHGLGFLTVVNLASGAKLGGFNDTYMRFLENHGASPSDYPSMSDAQRVAASISTGNLHWTGANVRAASGVLTAGKVGDHVRMFAPNPQQGGSSVSHWDTALSPDQLMEPNYTVPLHNPVLELPLFQDIGWPLSSSAVLTVSPATNIAASGFQGGPFSPSSFNYTLSSSSGSLSYSISGVPSWLTPSATSGTVTASGTTVTFTVNSNANSLGVGTYNATISFTNTTNGQGNTTRSATLTANPRPVLQVTPGTDIATSGNQGGPFSPTSFNYQLSSSTGSLNYSITGTPSWLTVSAASGTVTTSPSTVTFTVNANANNYGAGTYISTITFSNVTAGSGTTTRTATINVNTTNGTTPLPQTWVSVNGSDSNPCTYAQPCLTFQGAHEMTAARGQIDCLDRGSFGAITIIKSITIDCHAGFGSILTAGTNGVVINTAEANAIVTLRNINFNGDGTGLVGISILAASRVNIEGCMVMRFTQQGIKDARSGGGTQLFLRNTIVRNNTGVGVVLVAGAPNNVVLENVQSVGNAYGVAAGNGNNVVVSRSVMSGNVTAGVEADPGAQMVLDNSVTSNNGTGVQAFGTIVLANTDISYNNTGISGATMSFGNNRIFGNVSAGTAPTVGLASSDHGQQ